MTDLLGIHIHTPTLDVSVPIPTPSGPEPEEHWHVDVLDTWSAAWRVGECIVVEVELSLASFTPGRLARAWQPSAVVSVSAGVGWNLVQDVARPWPNVWPIMRAAWRRYALYPSGRPDQRMQAQILARGQLANPNYATWGPSNMPLPQLEPSYAAALATTWNDHYTALRAALTQGAIQGWYAEDTEDSPRGKPGGWIVWGPDDPGAPAGSGVYFSTGWQRNVEFARYALLASQCAHERMWHAYHRTDGQPITVDDYPGTISPDYSPGTGDPNNGWLPEFKGVASQDALPLPYDTSHRIRHDRYPIAAYELTGSPMCRRMVLGAAAQVRLQWTERGRAAEPGYNPMNLSVKLSEVQANPHQGIPGTDGGRTMGEPAFVIAAAKKYGQTGAENWAATFLGICDLASPPHGVLQRANGSPPPAVDAWYNATNDMAHSFEVPMIGLGALAIARQFALPIPAQIATAMRAVYEDSPLLPYYGANMGPWDYLYVAAHGGQPYPALTGGQTTPGSPQGDATHATLGCAIGYAITGNPNFLNAMARVGYPANSWREKMASLYAGTDLGWDAFALGQLQHAAHLAQP